MRWKVSIWLTISSGIMIYAQFHAIENDLHLQGVITAALPITTTPRDHVVRHEDQDNDNGTDSDGNIAETGTDDSDDENSMGTGDNINGTNSNEDISNNGPDGNTSSESNSTNSKESSENSSEDCNNSTEHVDNDNNTKPESTNSKESSEKSSEDGKNSTEHVDNDNTTKPESSASRSIESTEQEVIVLTELGEVKGHPYGSSDIFGFFDIPYGAFEGPFAAPTKPQPWTTVHDVKEHSKRCPQLDYPNTYVGDTDCLTLTIFASAEVQNASVLFHIHDGNFISGSGDPSIYGPDYLVSKGTVLVLPNYRLGPLGFLCLQNETAPGNAALKDLTLALEWTKMNIGAFGGKASDITVSGDGASGALVGYLALSATSRDFFTRAITESGSVLSHWAVDRDPIATATSLAETLRKNVNDESERTNIFHDIDIQKLLIAADNHRFKPCIEIGNDTFISETSWDVLRGDRVNISFMIGSANHAGMHEALYHSEESLSLMNENVEMFLPDDLEFDTDELSLATGSRVKNQYFGENTMSMTDLEKLSLYYTDASYLGPAIRGARPLAKAGTTVYFYEFSFVGDLNRERNSMSRGVQGAARGDIVGYVFTQDGEMASPDTPEANMVDFMTNLWTSFIKTGKPSAGNIEWNELKETSDSEEEWLSIELVPQLRKGLHLDRLRLWTEIYKKHFVDHNFAFGLTPSFNQLFLAMALLFGLRDFY